MAQSALIYVMVNEKFSMISSIILWKIVYFMDSKESFHKLFQNLVNVIQWSVVIMFGLWKMIHGRENKVGDVFALNNLVVSTYVTTLTPTALFTDHVSSRLLVIKPLLLRSVVLVSFSPFFRKRWISLSLFSCYFSILVFSRRRLFCFFINKTLIELISTLSLINGKPSQR